MKYSNLLSLGLSLAVVSATDTVSVELANTSSFPHYWKRSFGSGHATLTLRPDWQKHLVQAVNDLGLGGVRHHGLLDDDMRVVTAPGVYNFSLVEASWAFQIKHGVTPIVELSFMPAFLANCTWTAPTDGRVVNPGHKRCHTGMQYRHVDEPPTSFELWYDLVRALVQHAVNTFGLTEVQKWHFECWNEMWGMPFPNQYMKLYNASAHAVKSVHPSLRVGGPATMQLLDVTQFVQQAKEIGAPFDFVSTHIYPTDPMCPKKGGWGPDCLPDHVRAARDSIAGAGVPLFITEYNVGCCIGYPQHDLPGAAAFAFRTVAALDGVAEVLSWWTFTDIFEEGTAVARHTEFMNIYGLMTVSGVPKPGWRAFEMLHKHAGQRRAHTTVTESQYQAPQCTIELATNLAGFDVATVTAKDVSGCCAACRADSRCSFWTFANGTQCRLKNSDAGRAAENGATSGSSHAPPPPGTGTRIAALATTNTATTANAASQSSVRDLKGVSVFLSFWSDTGKEPDRSVAVSFAGVTSALQETAMEYRIDKDHANAHATWQAMGSPPKPTPAQVQALITASKVVPSEVRLGSDGSVTVNMGANSAVVLVY